MCTSGYALSDGSLVDVEVDTSAIDTEAPQVTLQELEPVAVGTELTLEQLEQEFPPEVTKLVALLTHDPREDYFEYIRRIKGNHAAKQIKLADLEHNSDESRLSGFALVAEAKQEAWRKKYKKAREILMEE